MPVCTTSIYNEDKQNCDFWVGCGVKRHENAVEWCEAVVAFAVTELALNRIYSLQPERHPLAARVLSTIGMQQDGLVRKRVHKGGSLVEGIVCWAILGSDWRPRWEGQS